MTPQNVANGLIRNRIIQVGQGANDAVVAPAWVFSAIRTMRASSFSEPRSSRVWTMHGAIELLSDQLSLPDQDRVGFGHASYFLQSLCSHTLSDLGQRDAFRVS